MIDIPPFLAPYIGIPHAPGASSLDECDCWGLLRLIYNAHSGRVLPPYSGPAWRRGMRDAEKAPIGSAALEYAEKFIPVPLGTERLFDGVLFKIKGFPIHVGMVIEPGWMIHVQQGADSTIEQYRPALMWENRIAGVFRHE